MRGSGVAWSIGFDFKTLMDKLYFNMGRLGIWDNNHHQLQVEMH
jgi:hypothetical protein